MFVLLGLCQGLIFVYGHGVGVCVVGGVGDDAVDVADRYFILCSAVIHGSLSGEQSIRVGNGLTEYSQFKNSRFNEKTLM